MHVKHVNKRKNANFSKVFHENDWFSTGFYIFLTFIYYLTIRECVQLILTQLKFCQKTHLRNDAKRRKSSTLSWVRIKTMTTSSGSVLIQNTTCRSTRCPPAEPSGNQPHSKWCSISVQNPRSGSLFSNSIHLHKLQPIIAPQSNLICVRLLSVT